MEAPGAPGSSLLISACRGDHQETLLSAVTPRVASHGSAGRTAGLRAPLLSFLLITVLISASAPPEKCAVCSPEDGRGRTAARRGAPQTHPDGLHYRRRSRGAPITAFLRARRHAIKTLQQFPFFWFPSFEFTGEHPGAVTYTGSDDRGEEVGPPQPPHTCDRHVGAGNRSLFTVVRYALIFIQPR